MHILIVEDDINLAKALGYILMENDHQVDLVHDGQKALDYGKTNKYDVIILDLMLPILDGITVCKRLRKSRIDTPILMLTAKDTIKDKIKGFDNGADDYMTKPFAPAELLAHLRALTRRKGELVFDTIEYEDLILNLENHDLLCKDKKIHLSKKEFNIIKLLLINKEHIISKEQLIDKVWGSESTADANNVEAYISFIRKKLKFLESKTKIETLHKTGYRIAK